MRHPAKRVAAAMIASGVVGIAILSPGSPAHASTACDGTAIRINTGSGAEPPSNATGHRHRTGNHYVRVIYSNGNWEWWADNNGGSDGDTRDTYYGLRAC